MVDGQGQTPPRPHPTAGDREVFQHTITGALQNSEQLPTGWHFELDIPGLTKTVCVVHAAW